MEYTFTLWVCYVPFFMPLEYISYSELYVAYSTLSSRPIREIFEPTGIMEMSMKSLRQKKVSTLNMRK